MKNLLLLSIFLSTLIEVYAQYCPQESLIRKYWERYKLPYYSLNAQSDAALIDLGSVDSITFTVLKGRSYRVSVYLDSVKSDPLLFKILDQEGHEIYDNKEDNLSNYLDFDSIEDKDLIIRVKVPDKDNIKKPEYLGLIPKTQMQSGCLIILIQQGITPLTGFH